MVFNVAAVPQPLLECVVETVDQARRAEAAGAARLELCVGLVSGGLTPPSALIAAVVEAVSVPVFTMIRPPPGDFVYSDAELAYAARDADAARAAGASGVVLGVLQPGGRVDVTRTRHLIERAGGLPVTFHRAFDEVADHDAALEDVIATGAARVLTSGGAASAVEGADRLRALVEAAGDRIVVMAGGGVRAANVRAVIGRSGVREVHARFESDAATRALVDLL